MDTLDRSGEKVLRVFCHIDRSARALHVKLACAHTLKRVIHGNFSVVTAREEQVAILVVDNLAYRTRVPWNVLRLHWRVSFRCHLLSFYINSYNY